MSHFQDNVPESVQARMLELAGYVKDNFDSMRGKAFCDQIGEEKLEEISGKAFDGFIPFQYGGYSVDCTYTFTQDSSTHYTEEQSKRMSKLEDSCLRDFCGEKGLDYDSFDWDNQELVDQMYDFESEWLSDIFQLVYFQCFADEEGNGLVITLRSGTNYKDSPYFREKYAEDIKSVGLDVEEFMSKSIPELFALIKF